MSNSDGVTVDKLGEEHEVAIVVFANTRGVDKRDATDRAVQALSYLLNGEEHNSFLPLPHREGTVDGAHVEIRDVMDVGMAAGNGYLWTEPTGKAFRQYERKEPPQ